MGRHLTVRAAQAAVCLMLGGISVLAGCGNGTSRPPYPALTNRLVAAFNSEYHQALGSSIWIASRSVPPERWVEARAAAQAVVRACNEGTGTWIVAVGLVNTWITKHPILVVFMNPPGPHVPPTSGGLGVLVPGPGSTVVPTTSPNFPLNNWYAAVVTSPGQPFCTYGYSPNLPALPTH